MPNPKENTMHSHDHEHESCGCGHDHGHEHHHHHHHTPSVGSRRKVYIIDGLDCANCAAKIERKINQLEEVEEATLTFATKQLRVTAKDPDALLSQMLEIARSVEGTATITPWGDGREIEKEKKDEKKEERRDLFFIPCGCGAFSWFLM